MPRYEVSVDRSTAYTFLVTIEAANEYAAIEEAHNLAHSLVNEEAIDVYTDFDVIDIRELDE